MEDGITVDVLLASCANCEDAGEVDRIRKRLQKCTVAELKAPIRRVKLPPSVHQKKKKAEVIETLLELGQAGQIKPSSHEDASRTLSSLDCEANDLALTTKEWLQRGNANSAAVWPRLRAELLGMTVDTLKVLAKEIGARLTNANTKGDIAERLVVLSRVGALSSCQEDAGEWKGLSYLTEEIAEQLSKLPKFEEITDWTKSLDCLEEFGYGQLFVYLVESRDKTFDHQSMRAFKSLKGYLFFADGFVKNMWIYCHPETGLLVFLAYCYHSLTTEPSLQVFVCLSKQGDVYSAQCNCISGLGAACSHIAAALFALESCITQKLKSLPVELSVTRQPMKWNQTPKKHVEPAQVKDITFSKPSHGKPDTRKTLGCARRNFDPRAPENRTLCGEDLKDLLSDVRVCFPESGLFKFWIDPEHQPLHQPPPVLDLDKDTHFEDLILFSRDRGSSFAGESVATPHLESEIMARFSLSLDVVAEVESATREQASCPLWHDLRNGRITSSRFGEVLHRRETTDPKRLVCDIIGYSERVPDTPALRWGRNNEKHARQEYLKFMEDQGHPVGYTESGLHLSPDAAYLGASSDGILHDLLGGDEIGCLEIKCPFSCSGSSIVHLSPADIAKNHKTFYLQHVDGTVQLKRSSTYYAQVQGEISLLGVDWCDFVVFTPAGLHVERIHADPEYWEQILFPKLSKFFFDYVLPELCQQKWNPFQDSKPCSPQPQQDGSACGILASRDGQTSLSTGAALSCVYLPHSHCQSRINGLMGAIPAPS